MYVNPFSMGPIGTYISHNGVQLSYTPKKFFNKPIMKRMECLIGMSPS